MKTPEEKLQHNIYILLGEYLPRLLKKVISITKLAERITELSKNYVEDKIKELDNKI